MTTETLVKTADQALILDGPNEVIAKRIQSIHETGKNKELKKKLINNFLEKVCITFDVSRENLPQLLAGLNDVSMEKIVRKVSSRSLKLSLLERSMWITLLLFEVGSLCKFFGVGPFVLVFGATFLTVGINILSPLLVLRGFADRDFFFATNIGYIKDRNNLRKIYGQNYFPIQELKEKLGLVAEPDNKEIVV